MKSLVAVRRYRKLMMYGKLVSLLGSVTSLDFEILVQTLHLRMEQDVKCNDRLLNVTVVMIWQYPMMVYSSVSKRKTLDYKIYLTAC